MNKILSKDDAEKELLIRRLFEVTGVIDVIKRTINTMFISVGLKSEVVDEMYNFINFDSLIDYMVEQYKEAFSTDVLVGVINFYTSDIGDQYLKSSANIVYKLNPFLETWFQNQLSNNDQVLDFLSENISEDLDFDDAEDVVGDMFFTNKDDDEKHNLN